jgi:DNA-binding NarL/FixJ family response regulator
MPIRVLIADDYMPFRIMLRYLLDAQDDIVVVGEAPDGEVAVRLADELEPDVVLLDLAMPRLDGWEAIPLVRDAAPDAKIIVLSGFPGERMRDATRRSDITRYLEKGEPEDVICAAVRDAAVATPR